MSDINRTYSAYTAPKTAHDVSYHDASLRFIDYLQGEKFKQKVLVLICSFVLALIILSFRPFAASETIASNSDGDFINQLGFLSLAILMSALLLTMASTTRVFKLATPLTCLFLLAVGISIALTPDMIGSARGVLLTLIVSFIAYSIIILPPRNYDFLRVIMYSSIALLAISYAGLVLFPTEAKHITDVFEPQHYGLWRGPFQHKNIAGPIFSVLTIFGIFIARSGHPKTGILIAILSFVFVINTGSKTTTGFLPLAVFMVLFARMFASAKLAVFMTVLSTFIVGLLTIGTIFYSQLENITAALLADPTFTGRVTLWHHGLYSFLEKPLFGYGFSNFWGTDDVLFGPLPEYAKWDFREIVHGHNNYIDILINFGLIGGIFIYAMVFIYPLINYIKAYRYAENRRLADMFMMIIGFVMLLSFMETFVLWRADPIWILHIFAVFGLHVLARYNRNQSGTCPKSYQ